MELQLQKRGVKMKLLISVNDKELSKYLNFTDSFIIGLKDYSVNYYELSIEEIEKLLKKYNDINLFISINKNIFNKDLESLEEYLIKLDKLKIKGVLFYDLSILAIVKRLNLNIPLVYHQGHLVTNYNICNFYKSLGCEYAYLSTEITADEMKEICLKCDLKLMAYFIGHPIISHSKRKLISKYYKQIKKDNKNNINIIHEQNKDTKYYIKENKLGTDILTYDILNGTEAFIYLKDKIEYSVLDNNLIDDDLFIKILSLYKDYLDNKISDHKLINEMKKLIGSDSGFFYKKTIYRVK